MTQWGLKGLAIEHASCHDAVLAESLPGADRRELAVRLGRTVHVLDRLGAAVAL